jgi:hypothetical protein
MKTKIVTMPDGTGAPLIDNGYFLVDFGPTGEVGVNSWLAQFQAALTKVGQDEWNGLPVPVEVVARGRSGRTILRIFAPDPTGAVYAAELAMDGDGPKVCAL